jgi:hypothetical protein
VFAWGACLYELLSGRIPYEGPDTRTTNSHVVKGDAHPPTHHDRTIPVPLSDVCMKALESLADKRPKDGGEAESMLRTAWERALTSGLVSPAALAGEEIPHERVPGGAMHGHVTKSPVIETVVPASKPANAGVATTEGEFDGNTTVESGPPAQMSSTAATEADPVTTPPKPRGKGQQPVLVIEGKGSRAGDDDPTRIFTDSRPAQPAVRLSGKAEEHAKMVARPTSADDKPPVSRTWLWVLLVLVVVAAGAYLLFKP